MTSELSPLKTSGGPPLRESEGFSSKKLSCDTHSWNPIAPGLVGDAGFDRADMPFAEVTAVVAGLAQDVRDGDLLRAATTSRARRCRSGSDGVR